HPAMKPLKIMRKLYPSQSRRDGHVPILPQHPCWRRRHRPGRCRGSLPEAPAKFRKTLMLWPFSRPRTRSGLTIEAIYGMIVAQARLPIFYERFRVPDTVNGRFDMVLLHLWLVLRRLRTADGGAALSQALFDHFCSDMDDNLREMGVGDLS